MVKKEVRIWKDTPARLVVSAEGYVMVRRKGGVPFVVSAKEWSAAPLADEAEHKGISSRLLKPGRK
ncbi:MAG: hypothetical protein EPN26_17005 [Rhodospirillales bacterium]|nr:MAG: hypothetical protein EPN26_17005 [Rhodospirillales bacterium]